MSTPFELTEYHQEIIAELHEKFNAYTETNRDEQTEEKTTLKDELFNQIKSMNLLDLTIITLHDEIIEDICKISSLRKYWEDHLTKLVVFTRKDGPPFSLRPQCLIHPFDQVRSAIYYQAYVSTHSSPPPTEELLHYCTQGLNLGFARFGIIALKHLIAKQNKIAEQLLPYQPRNIQRIAHLSLHRELNIQTAKKITDLGEISIQIGLQLAEQHGTLGYLLLAITYLYQARYLQKIDAKTDETHGYQIERNAEEACHALWIAARLEPFSGNALHNGFLGQELADGINTLFDRDIFVSFEKSTAELIKRFTIRNPKQIREKSEAKAMELARKYIYPERPTSAPDSTIPRPSF